MRAARDSLRYRVFGLRLSDPLHRRNPPDLPGQHYQKPPRLRRAKASPQTYRPWRSRTPANDGSHTLGGIISMILASVLRACTGYGACSANLRKVSTRELLANSSPTASGLTMRAARFHF